MRRLALFALVLACGGWVCNSAADDPCPGANTCALDVGTACCPFGEALYCGQCAASADSCLDQVYACRDDSRLLDCSFDATIEVAECTSLPNGAFRVRASGKLSGCGQELVELVIDNPLTTDLACGDWQAGTFGGCTPQEDAITTTSWTLDATIQLGPQPPNLTLVRAHGNLPTIASTTLSCTN